jgi:hypothetical protein
LTDTHSIVDYLAVETVSPKEKQHRMKMEIQYARDTSLSVPKNNAVFKIRTPEVAGRKSRDLTACEFGNNLKTLIEKKSAAAGKTVTMTDFIATLQTM